MHKGKIYSANSQTNVKQTFSNTVPSIPTSVPNTYPYSNNKATHSTYDRYIVMSRAVILGIHLPYSLKSAEQTALKVQP